MASDTRKVLPWFAAIGGLLLVVAFGPFVVVAAQAAAHHRVFLGVDSFAPTDDLQYLAWVTDAHHGLIRNLYGAAGERAVFVHPIWSPSGWIQAATGVSDPAILGFWTFASAAILFAGCLRLVTRVLPPDRRRARVVALALALFGGLTPAILLIRAFDPLSGLGTAMLWANDLVSSAALWGYAPMAIAIGLMPFAVDGIVRATDTRLGGRAIVGISVIGLLVAWLHPWQGGTLLAVVAALLLWRAHDRWAARRAGDGDGRPIVDWAALRGPLIIAAATAVPVLYYIVLARIDTGWAVAQQNNDQALGQAAVVAALVPIAAIGLWAANATRHDREARGPIVWLLATLLVVAATPSGQNRALAGIGLPVAVLVARAWPRRIVTARWLLASALGAAATLYPVVVMAQVSFRNLQTPSMVEQEPTQSDQLAARIAGRASGGLPIVSSSELGAEIPALADAPSWLGQSIWTPHYNARVLRSIAIFQGRPTAATERAALGSLRTHVLVQACGYGVPIERALAPLGFRVHQVGCARVYIRAAAVAGDTA